MDKEAEAIYKLIVEEQGHIYVCGDVTMAEHVYLTIRYVEHISKLLAKWLRAVSAHQIFEWFNCS